MFLKSIWLIETPWLFLQFRGVRLPKDSAGQKIPRPTLLLSARENGQLLTPESFKYCARVAHNELKNPLFHSHCLWHTHGTILAENGAQPKTVMERLGHKDLKPTMERYIFNTDKMQDDAVKLFMQATS